MGKQVHTEAELYAVYVLWLRGLSQMQIAARLDKRRAQVTGIIDRSPYRNRSVMTDGERQKHLDVLLANRAAKEDTLDKGLLVPRDFRIAHLEGNQIRGN